VKIFFYLQKFSQNWGFLIILGFEVSSLFLFLFFIHLFICAYIVWAISPPLPPTLSHFPTSSLPGRTRSAFSNFVEEKA
jgi:hypothetical protein